MSTASNGLTPHIGAMYDIAYINKAERNAPHAYKILRDLSIAVTAVAFAAIFSYPIAAAAIAQSQLTFTATYFTALPVLTLALDIILHHLNQTRHWFDRWAAAFVIEPADTDLNLNFFWNNAHYNYQHQAADRKEAPSATPAPTASGHPSSQAVNRVALQRAVVIGCNYPTVKGGQYKLSNCVNDAKHIQELLLNTGSEPQDITMMLDLDANQGKDVFPTKQNILDQFAKGLDDVSNAVEVNPYAIFYGHDSGHGTRTPEKVKGTEPGGMSDVMVAGDFEFIVDSDLKKLVKDHLKPKASAIFTFDCCHSGTMLDLPNNYKFAVVNGKDVINSEETGDELDYGSVVFISGCADAQTSADGGSIHGQGSGAMTAAFYSTLEEHSYHLTWRELLIGMNEKIKATGLQQNPQLSSSRKLDLDSYAVTSQIRFHPQIKTK